MAFLVEEPQVAPHPGGLAGGVGGVGAPSLVMMLRFCSQWRLVRASSTLLSIGATRGGTCEEPRGGQRALQFRARRSAASSFERPPDTPNISEPEEEAGWLILLALLPTDILYERRHFTYCVRDVLIKEHCTRLRNKHLFSQSVVKQKVGLPLFEK